MATEAVTIKDEPYETSITISTVKQAPMTLNDRLFEKL